MKKFKVGLYIACNFKMLQMYKKILTILISFILLTSTISIIDAKPNDNIPNQYIVELDTSIEEFEEKYGVKAIHKYKHAINGLVFNANQDKYNQIKNDPNVIKIQQNKKMFILEQITPTGIDRINSEINPVAKVDGIDDKVDVDIAVLDTGVDTRHPDLNIASCVRFIMFTCADENGHGTHVAGIIGAIDNDFGVVGVAEGARIHSVRVLDYRGQGTVATVTAGVDWAVKNHKVIDVINMSLGGSGSDDGNCGKTNNDILHQAICNAVAKGIVVVVASGNQNAKEVYLAEGSETALSILSAKPEAKVMATLSVSNFKHVEFGCDIKSITICMDNDGPNAPSDKTVLQTAQKKLCV